MKEYQNQIDAYLRDELSQEGKVEFESLLEQDDELREEFKIHQDLYNHFSEVDLMNVVPASENSGKQALMDYFESQEAENLKQTISRVRNQPAADEPSSKVSRNIFFGAFAMAASIALIIVFNIYNTDVYGPDLYAEYSTWESMPSLTVRQGVNDLSEAQSLFEAGHYQEVYDLLKSYGQGGELTTSNVLIYLSVTCIELNKFEEADTYLERLIASDAVDFSKGYWYQSLSLLKQDKKAEAVQVLMKIASEPTYYNHEKAKDLLEQLR